MSTDKINLNLTRVGEAGPEQPESFSVYLRTMEASANRVTPTGASASQTLADIAAKRRGSYVDLRDYNVTTSYSYRDDTVEIQRAINEAAAARIPLFIPGAGYGITGLTLPSNAHIIGSGFNAQFKLLPGSITHAFQLADPATTKGINLQDFQILGDVAANGSGIHLDNTGMGSGIPTHRVSNISIRGMALEGLNLGFGTRDSIIDRLSIYGCLGIGLNLGGGADSKISNCDVAQSGLDGVFVGTGAINMSNIKSWYSGAINNTGAGFQFTNTKNVVASGLISQENSGHGFSFSGLSGNTVTGISLQGVSDSDNKSNGGFSGFAMFNTSFCEIKGTVGKFVGSAGTAAFGVNVSGTSQGNNVSISVSDSLSAVVTGSALWMNSITVNGKSISRGRDVAYVATYTPDLTRDENISLTLTGNIAIALPTSNFRPRGSRVRFIFTQDATGGRTVTFDAAYRLSGWTPSTAAGKTNIIEFIADGVGFLQIGGSVGL